MPFYFCFLFLFSAVLYDRYLLQKQIKNLYLTNSQLNSNIEILNQKCLQLETSLACVKTANSEFNVLNVIGINNLSNLELNLSSVGIILVVTVIAGTSGWLAGKFFYSSFLFKSYPVVFLKSTFLQIAYTEIPIVILNKYDLNSEVDFVNHLVEHSIKKCTETKYTSLVEFLSEVLQTDMSTVQTVGETLLL